MKLTSLIGARLGAASASADHTVRAAMQIMSEAGLRFLPVVDIEGKLLGGAADGDIRRYLAAGGALDDSILCAANPSPRVITSSMEANALRGYMFAMGVECLPQTENSRLVALHVLRMAQDLADTTAVIMAGGLGSRLAPLTDNCPKPLLVVGDRPLLGHIVEHLRNQGVRRFVFSVNYLSGMIIDHFGDGSDLGVEIIYVHETMRMGTGGALGLIDPALLSDPFLVLNGDLLNDLDIAELRDTHVTGGWAATMVVRQHQYTIPYGVVVSGEDGSFIGTEEKPTFDYRINAGIYLLSKEVLPVVPHMTFYDLPTLFSDLATYDLRAGTHVHSGRWIDIGNMSDYERAQSIYTRKT